MVKPSINNSRIFYRLSQKMYCFEWTKKLLNYHWSKIINDFHYLITKTSLNNKFFILCQYLSFQMVNLPFQTVNLSFYVVSSIISESKIVKIPINIFYVIIFHVKINKHKKINLSFLLFLPQ